MMQDLTADQSLHRMNQHSTTHAEANQQQSSDYPGMQHKMPYITFAYTLFMIILTTTLSGRELGESVLFQLVLKAYPTSHLQIITAHVSLGHLE